LIQTHAVQHLVPNSIHHPEHHVGSVVRWIDMHSKRSFAERSIDNLRDGFRNRPNIGIVGHDSGESLLDFLAIAFIKSCFVLRQTLFVGGSAGMREVVGSLGKRSWHTLLIHR
jgi:hypothetical protein